MQNRHFLLLLLKQLRYFWLMDLEILIRRGESKIKSYAFKSNLRKVTLSRSRVCLSRISEMTPGIVYAFLHISCMGQFFKKPPESTTKCSIILKSLF